MILAIERTKFTYLYKYNQIRVDINQLIDKSINTLLGMLMNDRNGLILLLNSAIPLYEQDHEIILLEIDKSKINFNNGVLISFDSINRIYPITATGLQLLDGKINDDFKLEAPIFELAIMDVRLKRSMTLRKETSTKLLIHYNLDTEVKTSTLSLIESAVEKNLQHKSSPQLLKTFLDHLISYNKTPSFIPDGNIEHICKIGAIAYKYMDRAEEAFTNGPFYKLSLKYKDQINDSSYLASYLDFNSISDTQLISSIDKMVEIISKDYSEIDIFKVSFFFLAFKSYLNKHDNNIELLNNEIEVLINNDKQCASIVLAMIGFTFSIENIYEGLHRLSNAPLLKSSNRKNLPEIDKRTKRDIELTKQKGQKKEVSEQEKINLHQAKLPTESFNIQIKDDVSANLGNIPLEVINNTLENVSEPINIYENQVNEVPLEISKKSKKVLFEIKSDIDSIRTNEMTFEKEAPIIQNFKLYILKEQKSKTKQKNWFEFLDYHFPSKHDEFTLEILLEKMNTLTESKKNVLINKKDNELIKSFFDKYK